MTDPYRDHPRGLASPANRHATITPSDTDILPVVPRVLYCITNGTVALADLAGTVVSYPVVAGQILPFSPIRVMATGTTATVVGWW